MSAAPDQPRNFSVSLGTNGYAPPVAHEADEDTPPSDLLKRLKSRASDIPEPSLRYEEFIQRVQLRSGVLMPSVAETATRATLETLGERLRAEADWTAGELVESLARWLPEQLRGALRSPVGKEHERSEEFSLEELYVRVAKRSGIAVTEAEAYAWAVAGTLEEYVRAQEVERILSCLPDEFEFLFV